MRVALTIHMKERKAFRTITRDFRSFSERRTGLRGSICNETKTLNICKYMSWTSNACTLHSMIWCLHYEHAFLWHNIVEMIWINLNANCLLHPILQQNGLHMRFYVSVNFICALLLGTDERGSGRVCLVHYCTRGFCIILYILSFSPRGSIYLCVEHTHLVAKRILVVHQMLVLLRVEIPCLCHPLTIVCIYDVNQSSAVPTVCSDPCIVSTTAFKTLTPDTYTSSSPSS